MTFLKCFIDVAKMFVPFGWGIVCISGVIGYLAIPDEPRWIAASAWFISMIISFGFVIHIWRYHRSNVPTNYRILPEENQKNVSIKLIIAVIVTIITFAMSIYFWASNEPSEYADACAYTVSWIISSIWLFNLWKYHRAPKASFDQDKVQKRKESEEELQPDKAEETINNEL